MPSQSNRVRASVAFSALMFAFAACQSAASDRAVVPPRGASSSVHETSPSFAASRGVIGASDLQSVDSGERVTLFAQDPFGWSWSLRRNLPGSSMQAHQPVNLNADLGFDAYYPDEFSVAISGGDQGAIVDLGTDAELAQRFHLGEVVGGGRAFSSLRYVGGTLAIGRDDSTTTTQAFADPQARLERLTTNAHAAVHEGHIYLVRVDSNLGERFDAKLIVTEHLSRKSVSFRWFPLENRVAPDAPEGRVTTLVRADELHNALSLRTGEDGHVLQDGKVLNRDTQLCLGYFPECLCVGVQGGDRGAIVDLGSASDFAAAYGLAATPDESRAFEAIRFEHGEFAVDRGDASTPATPLRERAALQELAPIAHAQIHVSHLYAVRVSSPTESDTYAKLLVLEAQPNERVKFRWQRLGP